MGLGRKIIILTPPPYKVTNSSTMLEINFILSADSQKNQLLVEVNFILLKTKKPLSTSDIYDFSISKPYYNLAIADEELKNVFVVPNPYVVTSQFELPGNRPGIRGEKVIQFRNLPRDCTVRIYTITGELVRRLDKHDDTNYLNWDLLSDESARISYGIYIYQIETPSGGKKLVD